MPVDVVDWVLLEIRTSSEANSMQDRRAAFLKSDGSIVDLDGSSPVIFQLPRGTILWFYVIEIILQ